MEATLDIAPGGRLTSRSLTPFGFELEGDLAQPLSAAERDWMQLLLDRQGLILARGQRLTVQQQADLTGTLGPLLGASQARANIVLDDDVLGADVLPFHSDLAFVPQPVDYLSLHAIDVVGGETCTQFVSAVDAYRRLPPALRKRLEEVTVASISPRTPGLKPSAPSPGLGRPVGYDIPANAFRCDRAAIVKHKRSGEPILYVCEQQAARINGLSREESDALLAEIFAVLYAAEAVFEHRWYLGDIVVWDNMALQHGRPAMPAVKRRNLQRACVAQRGLRDQLPNYKAY